MHPVAHIAAASVLIAGGCSTQPVGARRDPKGAEPMLPQLVVLYFDGCPNTPPLLESARRAVARLGDPWELVRVDLEALPDDDPRRGYGSPTILLGGEDLFGLPAPSTSALSCRHYPGGLPTAEAVIDAVRAHPGGS